MAAHAYWRVLFTTSYGGTSHDVWLDEVIFLNAAGEDITVGGSALASSEYSTVYPAALAFDKTNSTAGWANAMGAFPAWIGYHFPAPVEVASVTLSLGPAEVELPVHSYMFVEYSDDGALWSSEGLNLLEVGTITVSAEISLQLWDGSYTVSKLDSVNAAPGVYNPVQGEPEEFMLSQDVTDCAPYGLPNSQAAIGWSAFMFKGRGRITGTTKNTPANPVSRLVRLFTEEEGALVAATWSDATGAYAFSGIDPTRKYTVLSYDHTKTYRAVVADRIEPELIP